MIGSIQIYKFIQPYLCIMILLPVSPYYKDTINHVHAHAQHTPILCIIQRIASEPEMKITDILLFAAIPKSCGLFPHYCFKVVADLWAII